jgi:hypothetical protein
VILGPLDLFVLASAGVLIVLAVWEALFPRRR